MLQKPRFPAGPASPPPPAREQLSRPSKLGVFRKQANWRNEPNLVFCQVSEFKQYAIISRAAQGQKRTQIEPKQTQNEPNFKANNAILTVRTGHFWRCLCRSEAANESIDENPPPSFDRERPNLKNFRNSAAKSFLPPRRRNGNTHPVHPTLEGSAERLKLAKRTQIIFDVKQLHLNAIR